MNKKAYDKMLSDRPYKTEIRECHCYLQDCRGRFLVKVGSPQTVCFQELQRIYYQYKIKPVQEIIEIRISI